MVEFAIGFLIGAVVTMALGSWRTERRLKLHGVKIRILCSNCKKQSAVNVPRGSLLREWEFLCPLCGVHVRLTGDQCGTFFFYTEVVD